MINVHTIDVIFQVCMIRLSEMKTMCILNWLHPRYPQVRVDILLSQLTAQPALLSSTLSTQDLVDHIDDGSELDSYQEISINSQHPFDSAPVSDLPPFWSALSPYQPTKSQHPYGLLSTVPPQITI